MVRQFPIRRREPTVPKGMADTADFALRAERFGRRQSEFAQ